MIRVDSRESPAMKKMADEVCLLSYENPGDPAHPYSYDVEVIAKSGQVLCYEVKRGHDAIASFLKLDRQLAPCQGIILEGWNPRAWLIAGVDEASIDRVEKRLWRLAHTKAIIYTQTTADTWRFLRYIEGKDEAVETRQ